MSNSSNNNNNHIHQNGNSYHQKHSTTKMDSKEITSNNGDSSSPLKFGSKIVTTVFLTLIKIIATLYSILTIPIYYYVQKPWILLEKSKQPKGIQLDPNNPYSPIVRAFKPIPNSIDGCETIYQLYERVCNKYGDKNGFGYRRVLQENEVVQSNGRIFRKFVLDDHYEWLTFNESRIRINHLASGYLQQGIKHGDTVMIMSDTRYEWMFSVLALSKIGASVATMYATLGEEGITHGINETEITHIITSHDQLPKLLKCLPKTPLIRQIIYFNGVKQINTVFPDEIKLISFQEVEELGKQRPLPNNLPIVRNNDIAILMYTSGSTGIPKGVMITHKNILSACNAYYAVHERLSEKDVYFGYLPLAHVLELVGEFFFMSMGMSIGYGTPLTMTDKSTGLQKGCQGDLSVLKPTIVAAVPLVLDRITKGIREEIGSKGAFAAGLLEFVVNYKRNWQLQGYDTPIINYLICNKIKQIMGGRLRFIPVGGAPLRPDTHEFLESCFNIKILQGYGLTEIGAAGSLMGYEDLSTGRVGAPLYGTLIKLIDWEEGNYRVRDKPYPRGEIICGGPMVTKGYFKNDQLTQECYFEENGIKWFRTGDIGELYPDGTVKIIDRRKDLIKLQFGEYISLGKVEAILKCAPPVDNICVIGDSFHDHLIALVVPNPKFIKSLAETMGKGHLSYKELCRDKQITESITKDMIQYSHKQGLNKMEIPAKIHLCSEEWLPDSGLVTAALKIRRKNIHDYYKSEIRNLYGNNSRTN